MDDHSIGYMSSPIPALCTEFERDFVFKSSVGMYRTRTMFKLSAVPGKGGMSILTPGLGIMHYECAL